MISPVDQSGENHLCAGGDMGVGGMFEKLEKGLLGKWLSRRNPLGGPLSTNTDGASVAVLAPSRFPFGRDLPNAVRKLIRAADLDSRPCSALYDDT